MSHAPVFDSHVDSLQLALDLGTDLGQRGPGHLDLVRGREGGLGAVVLTAWIDPKFGAEPGGARARTEALFDCFDALVERHPERVARVTDGATLDAALARGRIGAILGIEGGHAIEQSLELLEHYWKRGLRVMTLVWNNHLPWIRSCVEGTAEASTPRGLGGFGCEVVRRMNELGVLIDLSHAGERSFRDVIEVSSQPVIASHSGCRALHDHPRNLTDEQLVLLAGCGGVLGIPFLPSFLDREAQEAAARVREEDGYRALRAGNDTELWMAQGEYLSSRVPRLSIERFADHVVHVAERVGVEFVGIGSDFDGIQVSVGGLEDAECYGRVGEVLESRGFGTGEIGLVLGGNMRRVFGAATGG